MNEKLDVELSRCPWVPLDKPDYVEYHDREWGLPVHDDRLMFEFLTLESAQAGLSWYTVLRKREAYRQAYENFDPEKVARFDEAKIESLTQNPGLIRNRMKIISSVNNARKFLDVQQKYGSFSEYIWSFVDMRPVVHMIERIEDYRATSAESDALSRDLKQKGFKFLGSTICYAHMQATGMINDHSVDCFRRHQILGA